MSQQSLKSYLVDLGFRVDAKEYRDFDAALLGAARSVKMQTNSIGIDLIKWQAGIVGFFTTVSGAILGTVSKIANADQEYRLFGERMFTSTANARSLKIALDALGQPLEAIAFDPELHERFLQLQKDQKQMSAGLGGDFEGQMRNIRDMEFELTRFKVEFQFFTMGVVKNISQMIFGDGDVLKHLREINTWIITNIPTWSKQFATYLVPVLKDTWTILTDVAKLVGVLGNEFTNLVATFSGNDELRSTTFNFDKFAKSVGTVVHEVAMLLDLLLRLEKQFPILETLGGAAAGGLVGSVIPGVGTGIGAVVGGAGGAILGMLGREGIGPAGGGATAKGGASDDLIDHARQAAKQIGAETGANPAFIFEQWAHESQNFKYPGALRRNNFGGIRDTEGKYKEYGSFDDFAEDYRKFISKPRYKDKGLFQSKTEDEWAKILKNDGKMSYFEANTDAYSKGMKNFRPEYDNGGGSKTTTITVGDINVMQPHATADEIAKTVTNKIADQQVKENQRNLTQLTSVFQ